MSSSSSSLSSSLLKEYCLVQVIDTHKIEKCIFPAASSSSSSSSWLGGACGVLVVVRRRVRRQSSVVVVLVAVVVVGRVCCFVDNLLSDVCVCACVWVLVCSYVLCCEIIVNFQFSAVWLCCCCRWLPSLSLCGGGGTCYADPVVLLTVVPSLSSHFSFCLPFPAFCVHPDRFILSLDHSFLFS